VSCGLSASGAAGGQAGSVEVFDGELASDTITGDGETAAEGYDAGVCVYVWFSSWYFSI